MPSLNHLTCHIELARSNIELREYKTTYKDGYVETFIAVPDHSSNFQIRLTSDGYVAPGLAMFVFMDGKYQCNRNRRSFRRGNAQTPAKLFELVARQKEELQDDGKFIASSWAFDKLDIVAADGAPDVNEQAIRNIGNIEVIVLRTKNKEAYFDAPLPPRLYGKPAKGAKSGSMKDNVGKSTKGLKTNTKVSAGAAAANTMLKPDTPKLKAPNPRAPSTVSLAETLAGRSLVNMFRLFDGAADSDDPQFEHGREYHDYYNQHRPQSSGSTAPKDNRKRDDQSYIYRRPSSRNASRLGYKQVETILTPPRQSPLQGQTIVPSIVINNRYTDRPPVERRSSVSTALAAAYARQGIFPNKRGTYSIDEPAEPGSVHEHAPSRHRSVSWGADRGRSGYPSQEQRQHVQHAGAVDTSTSSDWFKSSEHSHHTAEPRAKSRHSSSSRKTVCEVWDSDEKTKGQAERDDAWSRNVDGTGWNGFSKTQQQQGTSSAHGNRQKYKPQQKDWTTDRAKNWHASRGNTQTATAPRELSPMRRESRHGGSRHHTDYKDKAQSVTTESSHYVKGPYIEAFHDPSGGTKPGWNPETGLFDMPSAILAKNAKDDVGWDDKSSKSKSKIKREQEQEHGGNRRDDTTKKSQSGGSRWDDAAKKSNVGGSNRDDTTKKTQGSGKDEDDTAKKSNTDGKNYNTAKTNDTGGKNWDDRAKKSNSGAKNRDNSAKKSNADGNNRNNSAEKRNEKSSGTGWNNGGHDRSGDKDDTWINQDNVMAPKKSEANWEKSSEKKIGQRRSPSHQPSDVAIADAVSYIKLYWAEWYHRPKPSTDFITKIERDRSTKEEQLCIRPAAPPLRVPANLAEEHNVDTQVRAGKGMRYVHKTQPPDYLDTMEKPFAVFAFKFRSREILEKILDVEIMEDVVDAKKQMLALSKEELVEELLRVKARAADHHASTPTASRHTSIAQSNHSASHHSSSDKAASHHSSHKIAKDGGDGSGWDNTGAEEPAVQKEGFW